MRLLAVRRLVADGPLDQYSTGYWRCHLAIGLLSMLQP